VITQGTDGLSRGIWANGFNTDFKSFSVEVFLPALPSLSLTKWALSHIEIHEEYAPMPLRGMLRLIPAFGSQRKLMHTNTFWVLSPGAARQGFTTGIVEPPWDISHLFLVPRIQQRSF
jgi:hypothetical protein